MALDAKALENNIFNAFELSQNRSADGTETLTELANQLATAIDVFVKSATVKTEVTGTVNGGVCTPLGPINTANFIGNGKGAPGIGIS